MYNAYYLDFQSKWTEYYPQIAVGDDVLVYGRVVNFHGTTPEFADRKCYVIPLPVSQYGKWGEIMALTLTACAIA